jgi:hypothetical protein
MAFAGSNNALAWAHFRLRGGWARSTLVTIAIIVVLAGIIVMMHRLNPDDADKILFGWTTGLLAVQAACLVLYIPGRIGQTIRADVQSKMIESHRLMPMPPAHAVAGYIMGAATQPLVFCCGVFFLGALVAAAAGVHVPRWAFANAVLLAFAAFVWVVSAYTSLGGRVGGGIMGAMIMIPWLSQGFVLALLPGMTVILSPVLGQSVFDFRTGIGPGAGGGYVLPATYAIALAAQCFFGTLCFIGAAREYRSPVEISLDTVLGLCFLLGWVAVSFAALRAWEEFRPRGWSPGSVATNVQVCASLIAALLVAIGPVAANARERARWRRHVELRDPYPTRRPWPIVAVIAIALLAILAIPFAPSTAAEFARPATGVMLRTAAVVMIALVGLYFFFDCCYALAKTAGIAATIWIVVTWGVPIAMDLVDYSIRDWREPAARFTPASPVGALMVLWTRYGGETGNINVGLGVQIFFALIPMCLWLLVFRRRRNGSRS